MVYEPRLQAVFLVTISVDLQYKDALDKEIRLAGVNFIHWTFDSPSETVLSGSLYLTENDFNILNEEIVSQPCFGGAYAQKGQLVEDMFNSYDIWFEDHASFEEGDEEW